MMPVWPRLSWLSSAADRCRSADTSPNGSRATIVARTVSRRGWISEADADRLSQMIAAYEKKERR
jgi:hypothetical protein